MYNDGFVLSIVNNGRTNREYSKDGNSIVHLPFGSEYAIRVKSKVSVRCKADVFIDGTNISDIGSFIISPYGCVDIERFLGADMSTGRKFKFERLSHPGVQDPNSSENGLVEVFIYREKIPAWVYTVSYPQIWNNNNITYDFDYGKTTCYTRSCNNLTTYSLNCEDGATVEGGISNQQFKSVSGFETESIPIILRVKILGATQNITKPVVDYCTRCGKKRNNNDNYCAKCGKKF